jgi:hypothetical protein
LSDIWDSIAKAAPFLAPYPAWVKATFAIWVLLTAGRLIALILARPQVIAAEPVPLPNGAESNLPEQDGSVWMRIVGISGYGELEGAKIQLTCEVNGLSIS